jgi:hypothetical protein
MYDSRYGATELHNETSDFSFRISSLQICHIIVTHQLTKNVIFLAYIFYYTCS